MTIIPLQGDGRVGDRVDRLFSELLSRPEWVKDIASADAMFVAAHSQGAIVSTHLLARLIEQRHLDTRKTKVCLLAMCGIHHGPFAHLRSTVTSSFINYFETAAAKELFEFQSSNAQVSKHYVSSLNIALKAGVKFCYVASVDDQGESVDPLNGLQIRIQPQFAQGIMALTAAFASRSSILLILSPGFSSFRLLLFSGAAGIRSELFFFSSFDFTSSVH